MSAKHENGENVGQRVPISAVYRQLDDHLAETEAPYDVTAGLGRLMEWMGKEVPRTRPIDDLDEGYEVGPHHADPYAIRSDSTARMLEERWLLLSELVARRTRSALLTFVIVVIFGASAGALLAIAQNPTVAVVVAVSVITALVTFAGVYLHRTTMQPLRADLAPTYESRTNDRNVIGDTQPQAASSGTMVDHTVDRSVTRQEGRQLGTWTSRGGFIPRIATIGLVALAAAGIVQGTLVPLGLVAALLLAIIAVVIFPAVWSRERARRESATQLLCILLAQEPNQPTRRRTGAPDKSPTASGRRLRRIPERSRNGALDEPDR